MQKTETLDKPKQIEKHKPINFSEFDEATAKFIASEVLPDWDCQPPEEFEYEVFALRKTSEDGVRLILQFNPELGAIRFTKQLKGTEFDAIDLVFPTQEFVLGDTGLLFEDSIDKRKLTFYSTLYRINSTGEGIPPFSEEIRFD